MDTTATLVDESLDTSFSFNEDKEALEEQNIQYRVKSHYQSIDVHKN